MNIPRRSFLHLAAGAAVLRSATESGGETDMRTRPDRADFVAKVI
jgi:hypothetical protein